MKSEKVKDFVERSLYENWATEKDIMDKEDVYELVEITEREAEEREQQLREKFASDIKRITHDWRTSDAKMDALHIKEMNDLKAKAVKAFCVQCSEWGHCEIPCDMRVRFINKLNE